MGKAILFDFFSTRGPWESSPAGGRAWLLRAVAMSASSTATSSTSPSTSLPSTSVLESRADVAQGIRSKIGRTREPRYIYSRGLNTMLNVLFRMRAKDNKSGFVLGPTAVLKDVLDYRGTYRYFQTFIRVAAESKGYAVIEVETLFARRHAGQSFIASHPVRLHALRAARHSSRARRVRRQTTLGKVAPADDTRRPGPGCPRRRGGREQRPSVPGWRRLLFETYFATMPLHKWLISRRARQLYLELKQTEWLSADDILDLQARKLQRLVQHAYAQVPYYRRRLNDAGISPSDIKSIDDLASLPMLSKDDVRRYLYFDLFADDHVKREMQAINTSGSTGEPFTTYADRSARDAICDHTARSRMDRLAVRRSQVRLWHQTIGMSKSQIVRERIDALFMRRRFIPAFEISSANVDGLLMTIRRHRPVLLDGYASH